MKEKEPGAKSSSKTAYPKVRTGRKGSANRLAERGKRAMNPVNLTRALMGAIILGGLILYTPVAYVAAAMMVFAGLTGT